MNAAQEQAAIQQALFVNCNIENGSHVMIECLRKVDAVTLADSADLFKVNYQYGVIQGAIF